ncbi:unnamed protein product [Cochlearia groenlandica]
MSHRLRRLFKLSCRSNVLVHNKNVRLFSTGPYLTLGCNIVDVVLFEPAKEELVTVPNKTIPKELIDLNMMGASHGWGFFYDKTHLSVRITDIFNPFASKSKPEVIHLPRLTLHSEQTEQVCNVAMSSSSPHGDGEECCVVAIKFLGRQVSMCRPGLDVEWTNISTPFNSCEYSNLMYSKRDKRFYLTCPGGKYLLSYNLNSQAQDNPLELHEFVLRDHPEFDQSEWESLSSCSRTEYFVESPSDGERFLIKWYAQSFYSPELKGINYKTKRFIVFREEETTEGSIMCYTEDIGDVCIFLASNEAFCVPASSIPGLKPNSIYFAGRGFGCYNLTTGEAHHYKTPHGSVVANPYWLPPFSI